MPFYMFWDPTYILVILGSVLAIIASGYMKSVYGKYSQIGSRSGMTGEQAAQIILRSAQIQNVPIHDMPGELSDNYNPKDKSLNLSQGVRYGGSIADLGVAAHECGHAIQDHENYWALGLRSFMYPVVSFGSVASWPIIILGVILSWNQTLINIGIFMFILVMVFQLVTLPVEFNASRRALQALDANHVLTQDELEGTKKVLRAAALTYVAAAAATALQLARLIMLFGGRRNDD